MDADVLDFISLFDLVDLLYFTLFPSILVDTHCWDPFYYTVNGLASISSGHFAALQYTEQ